MSGAPWAPGAQCRNRPLASASDGEIRGQQHEAPRVSCSALMKCYPFSTCKALVLFCAGGGPMREAQWAHRARKGLKYETLAAQLRSEIISGKWTPGTKVPTESELIKETGFSLTTVRKAYEALVEEGLVTRQRGAGTFVREWTPAREGRRGQVGLVLPETALYYAKVLQGLESTLATRRVALTLATS